MTLNKKFIDLKSQSPKFISVYENVQRKHKHFLCENSYLDKVICISYANMIREDILNVQLEIKVVSLIIIMDYKESLRRYLKH